MVAWTDKLQYEYGDLALSRVLNGRAAISPEMAIRLEKAGWFNAEFWLRRQTTCNLVQACKSEDRINVERYQPQAV